VSERGYLSIGEVLTLLQEEFPDVTISKIRFLESQGLIDPERTPSGYRKFYTPDVERLRFILREQRERFLPLKVIKDRLDSGEPAGDDEPEEVGVVAGNGAALPPEPPTPAESAAPAGPAGPAAPVEPPAAEATPVRVPAWMQKAVPARAVDADELQLTADELAAAAGLTASQLRQVEEYGLLAGTVVGRSTYYDADALVVARVCAGLMAQGLEGRHLRAFRTSVDRESGLYEQVVMPLVKQRNPQAKAEAQDRLRSLTRLGGELREALLRHSLRPYAG
jgi:DNA-binding transcriptional MerR regulator